MDEAADQILSEVMRQAEELESEAAVLRKHIEAVAVVEKRCGRLRAITRGGTAAWKWQGIASVIRASESTALGRRRGIEAHTVGQFYIAAHEALEAEKAPSKE